jgi:hypothetical protein
MMVHAVLCGPQARSLRISAAVDALGGVGRDWAARGACKGSPPVPFLKLQGKKDPFVTFDR